MQKLEDRDKRNSLEWDGGRSTVRSGPSGSDVLRHAVRSVDIPAGVVEFERSTGSNSPESALVSLTGQSSGTLGSTCNEFGAAMPSDPTSSFRQSRQAFFQPGVSRASMTWHF